MKKIVLLCLFLLTPGLAHAGRPLANFTFTDLEENIYTDENLRGTPVVIYVTSHL